MVEQPDSPNSNTVDSGDSQVSSIQEVQRISLGGWTFLLNVDLSEGGNSAARPPQAVPPSCTQNGPLYTNGRSSLSKEDH